MRRVIWTEAATGDLKRLKDWLDERAPSSAQATIDRIVLATDWLLEHPAAGPAVGYRRWRKWRPAKTGYLLLYEPTKAGLTVVRVVHARSDWRSLG